MTELYKLAYSDREAGYIHCKGDDETLVTFNTISHQLQEARELARTQAEEDGTEGDNQEKKITEPITRDAAERLARQTPEARPPGIHKVSNGSDRPEYVIVVPGESLAPSVCRHWIRQLNNKYDRGLELLW